MYLARDMTFLTAGEAIGCGFCMPPPPIRNRVLRRVRIDPADQEVNEEL